MSAVFSVIGRVIGYALRPAFRRYLESWSDARAEFAEAPGVYVPPDLPPCGMRIALTREQVAAAIAGMEQQFPQTKTRRNR